jgi:uncharacterized protein YuzE
MKITYDPDADAITIRFNDAGVRESDEITPNVIADFGEDGEVVGIEILSASRLVADPRQISLDILAPEPAVR